MTDETILELSKEEQSLVGDLVNYYLDNQGLVSNSTEVNASLC